VFLALDCAPAQELTTDYHQQNNISQRQNRTEYKVFFLVLIKLLWASGSLLPNPQPPQSAGGHITRLYFDLAVQATNS
jgi:hypothetical protein